MTKLSLGIVTATVVILGALYLAHASALREQKLNAVRELQRKAQSALDLRHDLNALVEAYYARGYNSTGTNPITATDLIGTDLEGIPVADINAAISMIQALDAWIVTNNYVGTLAKIITAK